jgi:hypothetical protein
MRSPAPSTAYHRKSEGVMIESYAFLAAFAVQILAMSVLGPVWFTRHVRIQATNFPAERFAERYPGIDHNKILERYLTLYRVLNFGIEVLGLSLMGWLISYLQRPDWDDGPVEALVGVYFIVQVLPLCLVGWIASKYNKLLGHLLEGKRKAHLRRRGLFDFVSPFTIFLAALGYLLFVAYLLYIAQNPFPGFAGPLINFSSITLIYAVSALGVYRRLYGRKLNPFETHAAHMYAIGWGVKGCVYICIVAVVALSLNFTLVLLDLQRWEPFAQSVFFVTSALLSFRGFTAPSMQQLGASIGR